jgi:serine O-acetyltransferase
MQLIMRLHLLSRWFLRKKLRPLSKLTEVLIRLTCAARIPTDAEIDPTVTFSHNGLAVVLTKETRIGAQCQIGTHAIIGSNWPKPGAPRLEDNVIVGPGAIVLGPLTLGRGCVVAAGSIVLTDVLPGTLVAGNPAIEKKQNVDSQFYKYPKT